MNHTSAVSEPKQLYILRLISSKKTLYYSKTRVDTPMATDLLARATKFSTPTEALEARSLLGLRWRMGATVEFVEFIPAQLKIIER